MFPIVLNRFVILKTAYKSNSRSFRDAVRPAGAGGSILIHIGLGARGRGGRREGLRLRRPPFTLALRRVHHEHGCPNPHSLPAVHIHLFRWSIPKGTLRGMKGNATANALLRTEVRCRNYLRLQSLTVWTRPVLFIVCRTRAEIGPILICFRSAVPSEATCVRCALARQSIETQRYASI